VPAVAAAAVALAAIIFFATRGGGNTPTPGTDTAQVVAVADTIPIEQPVQSYRTEPRNLDLQVTLNGTKYYFSQSEWANLSSSEQSRFEKCGVVIDYNGQCFVVRLNMERRECYTYESEDDSRFFSWKLARQWARNMGNGWRLPTLEEGKAMAEQHTSVNSALDAFGGDSDYWYWTSDGSFFHLGEGYVCCNGTATSKCLRVVCAI
ncbi:MAG: hypothetical protein ACI4AM_09500, partial [Muribaculaceae bacterium]